MRLAASLLVVAAACPAAEFDALPDVAVIDEHAWTMAASRRRQRLETAPQPVTVISGNELNDTPATTIADRLRYVPGVDVYQARNGQYDIGLRGWNGVVNNRVLVLVDGDPFRQEEFGLVHWTGALFHSDIERIELIKGPASPSYGANAFGGARQGLDQIQIAAGGVTDASFHHLGDAKLVLVPLGALGRVKHANLWREVIDRPGELGAGLAIKCRVMALEVVGRLSVFQAFDHIGFPEGATAVQQAGMQSCDKGLQLESGSGLGQDDVADVVVKVDIIVFDPYWISQFKGHGRQLVLENSGNVRAIDQHRLHVVIEISRIAIRQFKQCQTAHMHGGFGRFQMKERCVQTA